MPRGKKVGEAFVEIWADNAKLKKGVKDSEAEVQKLGKAASLVQETISKIVIPAAIARSVTAIIGRFEQLRAEASKFRNEMQTVEAGFARFVQTQRGAFRQQGSELDKVIAQIRERGVADKEQADAIARQNAALAQQANAWERINRAIAGAPSANEILAEAARTNDLITRQTEAAVRAARREFDEFQKKQAADRVRAIEEETEALRASIGSLEDQQSFAIAKTAKEAQKQIADAFNQEERDAIQRNLDLRLDVIRQEFAERRRARDDAAADERRREEEAHRKRLQDIEEESRQRLRDLDEYFRRQEEGFDRLNQDLIVGLGSISSALEQLKARDSGVVVLGGGA